MATQLEISTFVKSLWQHQEVGSAIIVTHQLSSGNTWTVNLRFESDNKIKITSPFAQTSKVSSDLALQACSNLGMLGMVKDGPLYYLQNTLYLDGSGTRDVQRCIVEMAVIASNLSETLIRTYA